MMARMTAGFGKRIFVRGRISGKRDTHIGQFEAQVHVDDGEDDRQAAGPVVRVVPDIPDWVCLHARPSLVKPISNRDLSDMLYESCDDW